MASIFLHSFTAPQQLYLAPDGKNFIPFFSTDHPCISNGNRGRLSGLVPGDSRTLTIHAADLLITKKRIKRKYS